ncbi:ABC transporter permease subunit [Halopseudomonas phragmitis]|uniref:Phosphate ABC transporter permease n=2 Tax=Pseudomonadaceae TaxID=135621 RepID=A0A1V0B2K8_9GAMM|nr:MULTISPECIES: ABC transporter permease subunit [Pseudomonadaceae]AQZ94166.1 phosphate ABC transporter permease [Halopseudomonas phragmitis]RHW20723.1 phosphate ABC transporter permease [Pseudomonas jilinensis]
MTDITSTIGKSAPPRSLLPDAEARKRLRQRRLFKDNASRWGISAAGFGVVFALALIFIYLFYEVAPILRGASVTPLTSQPVPVADARTQAILIERYEELGFQYSDDGQVSFFELANGNLRSQLPLNLPEGAKVTSFAATEPGTQVTAHGLDNGQVVVVQHAYTLSFPEGRRVIAPRLEAPLGSDPITLDEQGQALKLLAIESRTRGRAGTMIAGVTEDNRLLLANLATRTNLMTGATSVDRQVYSLPPIPGEPVRLLVDKALRSLYVADRSGKIHYYDVSQPANARLVTSVDAGNGSPITAMEFLVGTVSLIVGTERGELSQWFLVRDAQNRYDLTRIRDFKNHGAAITAIAPEYNRKGFIAGDAKGQIGVHYGTSSRTLYLKSLIDRPIEQVAVSPLNGRIMAQDDQGQLHIAELWNQHPQLSFAAMWNKVWYEGRADPEYIWQSSSATDEFESKFSLVPLSVGTLKAAFYAMLFAMPLAIAGAIYTAYFMTPKLRGIVKPSIEIMEALPTVILGFLAGLWLAPFTEEHLPAIFSILLLLPVMMLVFAFIWTNVIPAGLRQRIPDGWEAALLVPVIIGFVWLAVFMSPLLEIWFFNGSMRQWFTDIGITYDQRNALIVGIAMGFAVIPTIFSIAEDAVFTVPKHLTQGSLALGATRWQTVIGVVLPTASPGIFSAVMMGFGRAVGETMIVLMATGNSPVVNFNIFEGMRTLSANIAVELPETAVGSSHFRVLFLAALVLLALTFIVNTLAEIIRQRLRARYSNL